MKTKTTKKKLTRAIRSSILARAEDVHGLEGPMTACFYGRSGTGKTVLASTFPKPCLFLDISEKGTDSITDVEGCKRILLKSWDEFEEVYWELAEGKTGYRSVAIDSVHALQSLAIDKAKTDRKKTSEDQVSKYEFMRASSMLQQWLVSYRDLVEIGMNVVYVAHDRVVAQDTDDGDDEGAIAPEVGPRLMPSVASTLTGAVNVVANTFIRERTIKAKELGKKSRRVVEYCLRVGPHSYYNTKIRSPKSHVPPSVIVDATYEKLVAVVRGRDPGASQANRIGDGPKRKLKRRSS